MSMTREKTTEALLSIAHDFRRLQYDVCCPECQAKLVAVGESVRTQRDPISMPSACLFSGNHGPS